MDISSTSRQESSSTPVQQSEDTFDETFFTVPEEWTRISSSRLSPLPIIRLNGPSTASPSSLSFTSPKAKHSPGRLSPQSTKDTSHYGDISESEHSGTPSSDEDENGHSAGDRYERALAFISAERLRHLTLPAGDARSPVPNDYFSHQYSSSSAAVSNPPLRPCLYPGPSPSSFYSFCHSDVPETIEEESEEGSDWRRSNSSWAQAPSPVDCMRRSFSSPNLTDRNIDFGSPNGRRRVGTDADLQEIHAARQPNPTLASQRASDPTQAGQQPALTEKPDPLPHLSSISVASPDGSSQSLPSSLQDRFRKRLSRSSSSVGSPRSVVSSECSDSIDSPLPSHRKSWKRFFFSALEGRRSAKASQQQPPPRLPLRASSLVGQIHVDLPATGIIPGLRTFSAHTEPPAEASTHASQPSWRKRLSSLPRQMVKSPPEGSALGLSATVPPMQRCDEGAAETAGQSPVLSPAADRHDRSRASTSIDYSSGPPLSSTVPSTAAGRQMASSQDSSMELAIPSDSNSLRRIPNFSQLSVVESVKERSSKDKRAQEEQSLRRRSLSIGEDEEDGASSSTREGTSARYIPVTRRRSFPFGGSAAARPLASQGMIASLSLPDRSRRFDEPPAPPFRSSWASPISSFLGVPDLVARWKPMSFSSSSVEHEASLPPRRPTSVVLGPSDLRFPRDPERSRRRSLSSTSGSQALMTRGIIDLTSPSLPSAPESLDPTMLAKGRMHPSQRSRKGDNRKSVEVGIGMGLPMHRSLAAGFGWKEKMVKARGGEEDQEEEEEKEEDEPSTATTAKCDGQDGEELLDFERAAARQRAMDLLTGHRRRPGAGAVAEAVVIPPALRSTPGSVVECVEGGEEGRRGTSLGPLPGIWQSEGEKTWSGGGGVCGDRDGGGGGPGRLAGRLAHTHTQADLDLNLGGT